MNMSNYYIGKSINYKVKLLHYLSDLYNTYPYIFEYNL